MTLIKLTREQLDSLSHAEGRVAFADPQGRVVLEIERTGLDPHRLRVTTIPELIEELSEEDIDPESLKLRLQGYTPTRYYRQ